MEHLLGKWYALDPYRYYRKVMPNKDISYYKMYVHRIVDDKIYYDSFIQFADGTIEALKVDKEASLAEFQNEIEMTYLSKNKTDFRKNLNDIGRKYGLDISVQVS